MMFLGRPFVRDSQILHTSRSWSQTCLLYACCHFTGRHLWQHWGFLTLILAFCSQILDIFSWLTLSSLQLTLTYFLSDLRKVTLWSWACTLSTQYVNHFYSVPAKYLVCLQPLMVNSLPVKGACWFHFWIVETEITYIELKSVFL